MAELRRPSVRSFSARMPFRLKTVMRQAGYRSRAHDLRLRGKHPLRILGTPKDPWPGDRVAGAHLLAGRFVLNGHVLRHPHHEQGAWAAAEIWSAADLPAPWQEHLHSFAWLRDLGQAVDRLSARKRAEDLVRGWLDRFESWEELAWRPDLVGRRLINWLAYAPLIMDTDDLIYRSRVLDSLARQARHLMYESPTLPEGPDQIYALAGLAQAGLYIPHGEDWLKRGLNLLVRQLPEEVLPDGGVQSRNPEDVLRLLKALVMLKTSLKAMGHDVPDEVEAALGRLGGLLRLLRHGDGRLALFNGASERSEQEVDALLSRLVPVSEPAQDALQGGFRRLEKNGTCLIVDSGPPAFTPLSRRCHAGTLSFELSSRAMRIIVNCGSGAGVLPGEGSRGDADLFDLSRTTAAHSTLVVENRNSAELLDNGLIGAGPTVATSRRIEERGDVLLELSHDGYVSRFGRKHWRLIYMNGAGDDIRGEDILEQVSGRAEPVTADIRFHVHPAVNAHLMDHVGKRTAGAEEAGRKVRLRLVNDEVWLFQARGAHLRLEDSIYLGTPGRVQQTRQIVLSTRIDGPQQAVKWSIRRIMDA